MMHSEALVWLTTGIGGPLSVVWLCWAILVLWFGRGQWRPSDPLLIALLVEAIAKQAAGTAGSALSLFRPDEPALCSAVQWLWTAAHTMQAGTLASLALMAGLRRRKRTVTAGGRPLLLYHLASLSAVSACVGAAALIAQTDPCAPPSDRRYAVFSLVLHASLALVAGASAAFGCAGRRKGPNPLLVNSSSDLSSCMSEISTVSSCGRPGIRHSVSDCSDRTAVTTCTGGSSAVGGYRSGADCGGGLVHDLLRLPAAGSAPPVTFLNGAPCRTTLQQQQQQQQHSVTDDDGTLRRLDETKRLIDSGTLLTSSDRDSYAASTIRPYRYGGAAGQGLRYPPSASAASMSVSSTNSRAPCLAKRVSLVQDVRIGYVVAILFMCYFVDHLPVLVLMASEHFLPSKFVFSADYAPVVKNFPMLAALAEACLWPVVLLLFDDQFVPRLSNLYRRQSASDRAKPPQGLHGKFRPYNSSLQDARRPPPTTNGGSGVSEAVRFPITNGSLFASLDGRVPALHNYRRGIRTMSGLLVPPPPHFIHTSTDPGGAAEHECCNDDEHHRDHHHHHQQQQQQHHRSLRFANMVTASAAMATAGSVSGKPDAADDSSTPVDSLDDAIIVSGAAAATNAAAVRAADSRLPQNLQQLREKLYAQDDGDDDEDDDGDGPDGRRGAAEPEAAAAAADDDSSSDDGCDRRDDGRDCDDDEDDDGEYATLSARSVCSATTAANDDFEYFAAAVDRTSGGDGPQRTQAPVDPPPGGGRVPYQRAPTRRARHHQPPHQPQQQHQQQHHHHHHRHRQPLQYQQQHHLHQRHRQMQRAAPAPPPTPPTPRRPKARLTSVLSVDSLVAAQAAADAAAAAAANGFSRGSQLHLQQQQQHNPHHYPHGGGRHHRGGFGGIAGRRLGGGRGHHGGSVPDLKRVFITDFL